MKFKSQLVTQVSGSIGGTTFAHNRGGMYQRARSIPTDPNSPLQQTVRSIFGSLAILWQTTLSSAQRDAWDTYGANVPVLDAFGDQIFLTGFNHYIRSNTPRVQAATARVDDGPTAFNLGQFTNPAFSYDSTASEVDTTFTDTDAWANEDDAHAILYASRQQSDTINFFKGPYRLMSTINGDAITPPTSPAADAAPFPCAVGNRCFVRWQVSRADGRLSLPFRQFGLGA
jgi:hypothetical protein